MHKRKLVTFQVFEVEKPAGETPHNHSIYRAEIYIHHVVGNAGGHLPSDKSLFLNAFESVKMYEVRAFIDREAQELLNPGFLEEGENE